jgi:hyaluronoglucosaminidase
MHLGPVINRDADLCEAVDGYMSNPLCQQNEWNRIPLLTCADYAYNPYAYDPMRSIGQAILHLGRTPEEREVLKEAVEVYPGFVIWGRPSTGLNPVREQFSKIIAAPHSRYVAEAYVRSLEALADRADRVFPDRCEAERQTLRNDIEHIKSLMKARYGD